MEETDYQTSTALESLLLLKLHNCTSYSDTIGFTPKVRRILKMCTERQLPVWRLYMIMIMIRRCLKSPLQIKAGRNTAMCFPNLSGDTLRPWKHPAVALPLMHLFLNYAIKTPHSCLSTAAPLMSALQGYISELSVANQDVSTTTTVARFRRVLTKHLRPRCLPHFNYNSAPLSAVRSQQRAARDKRTKTASLRTDEKNLKKTRTSANKEPCRV